MKAQVESRISYTELEKLEVLISILNRINACENESELRDAFSGKKVDWYKTYFKWGFGAKNRMSWKTRKRSVRNSSSDGRDFT